MTYLTNIVHETIENQNFRRVLHTGDKSQLVVMNIPPGEEIGIETHHEAEQTLFFLGGSGLAVLNGTTQRVHPGDVLMIEPGTEHNVLNTGSSPLKIYTLYAPPNHIDGRVHATKADADRDEEDEAFGHHAASTNGVLLPVLNREMHLGIRPGILPDPEPRPTPSSPLENPEAAPISIHDTTKPEPFIHTPISRTKVEI